MFEIKVLKDRVQGYFTIGYSDTPEDARRTMNQYRTFFNNEIIDIYYTYKK